MHAHLFCGGAAVALTSPRHKQHNTISIPPTNKSSSPHSSPYPVHDRTTAAAVCGPSLRSPCATSTMGVQDCSPSPCVPTRASTFPPFPIKKKVTISQLTLPTPLRIISSPVRPPSHPISMQSQRITLPLKSSKKPSWIKLNSVTCTAKYGS